VPATLRSLRIRNLALVESLDWELASGFSVVTGETGTGKSIIVGALKLVLGERADKSLIRTGADQCAVEALFELEDILEVDQMLGEQGIDACEEGQLLLKRIFSVSGGSRQFINGSQTTLGVLKQVGDGLVDQRLDLRRDVDPRACHRQAGVAKRHLASQIRLDAPGGGELWPRGNGDIASHAPG